MDMSSISSDCDRRSSDPDENVHQSVDLITSEFHRQIDLESNEDSAISTSQLLPDSEVHDDSENREEEEEEDDGDFTFMFVGEDDSPIFADKVFEDGQIRQVFPLFDQKLLLSGEYEVEEIDRLPVRPPVDKVFIKSPRISPSSGNEENDDAVTGPYCVWSKESVTSTAELSKKSNSTGFSKLWRIREKVSRSNSDGRDAFVFLKSSDRTTTTTATSTSTGTTSTSTHANPVTGGGSFVKVNAAGGKSRVVKQGTKAKKPVSAHEAYLRSKGGHTEEERRRSYLPYRPELMGFFTNVHGGLSKNVHPY